MHIYHALHHETQNGEAYLNCLIADDVILANGLGIVVESGPTSEILVVDVKKHEIIRKNKYISGNKIRRDFFC